MFWAFMVRQTHTGGHGTPKGRCAAPPDVGWRSRRRLVAGEGSSGGVRAFCSVCASPIFARVAAKPEWIRVRIGGLAGELDVRITAHVWVSSKSSWFEIADVLPQYPDRFWDRRRKRPERSGAVRRS
jgi:hypothetical protein